MASTTLLDRNVGNGTVVRADGAEFGLLGVATTGPSSAGSLVSNSYVAVGSAAGPGPGPASGGANLEWDTQRLQSAGGNQGAGGLYPAPYNSAHLGWTELVNADGSATANAGGFDFYTGANGQAVPKYCASVTTSVEGLLTVGSVQTQIVVCEGLKMANTLLAPTVGEATLVAGTATVLTGAADPACQIFITPAAVGGNPAQGTYVVTQILADRFVVESRDATGTLVAADVGKFFWMIVNPNFA